LFFVFFCSALGLFSRIYPVRVCCYGFHLLLYFGRRCWLMVDLWPGMEIEGETVVAGCCGEELLLLWCSLEEKRLNLQAPPEGEGRLLRAGGRCCCCCCHRWGEELETTPL
jgi:hypothetical protein